MLRIQFAAEDRQRYNLPEQVEIDVDRPRLSEIRRLKAEVDWPLSRLSEGLRSADLDEQVAARAVLWWLAINRHTPVSWEEFECDPLGAQWEQDEDPNRSAPDGASIVSTS